MDHQDYKRVEVLGKESLAAGVYRLIFTSTGNFIPGQVVGICMDPNEPARLYSLAGDCREAFNAVLFDVVEEGFLTPRLSGLEAGASFWCSAPFGSFRPSGNSSVLIATGTGIAPFASLFFSGKMADSLLIHGGRYMHSFYFSHQLLPSLGERYIRCCSGEKGEGVYNGRLTTYLREKGPFPPGKKYYLCGSAEMVVEVRDILISQGIPFHHILSEIYF